MYSDVALKELIEDYRSDGRPLPRGIYGLAHDIYLYYFKEENGLKYICIMNMVSYDKSGKVIPDRGGSNDTLEWHMLPPDSKGEWVFDNIRARVPN